MCDLYNHCSIHVWEVLVWVSESPSLHCTSLYSWHSSRESALTLKAAVMMASGDQEWEIFIGVRMLRRVSQASLGNAWGLNTHLSFSRTEDSVSSWPHWWIQKWNAVKLYLPLSFRCCITYGNEVLSFSTRPSFWLIPFSTHWFRKTSELETPVITQSTSVIVQIGRGPKKILTLK